MEEPSNRRRLIAAVVVVLLVLAVWRFIEVRMQPPRPPAAPELAPR